MIVVLMITIIVVGLAFTVLNLVWKQMGGIVLNYEKNTEINLLRQALWIDFNTYPKVYFDSESNILHCENELGTVNYIFEDERMIREKDTFRLKFDTLSLFYDGVQKKSGQVDALELSTPKENGGSTIFVFHENAALKYMD